MKWLYKIVVLGVYLFSPMAFAGSIIATGWVHSNNPEIKFAFLILQIAGLCACMKSLRLVYEYHLGLQTRKSNLKCFLMFLAGTALYYPQQAISVIINSLF